MSIAQDYKGRSQDEIMRAMNQLSDEIVQRRRKADGQFSALELQHIRQQRAQLGRMLHPLRVVWPTR